MVLLTYIPGPPARTLDYEEWLRKEDNPTFNRIPGIDQYSNWKIIAPDWQALPWSHFDFVGLDSPESLERYWFNPELDEFRKGWVAKWGYGATGGPPSDVVAHGHLCQHRGPQMRVAGRWAVIERLDGMPTGDSGAWEVRAALRKHYAIGAPPPGQSWKRPTEEYNPLGWKAFRVSFHDGKPQGNWSENRLLAECIAAPGM